MWKLAGENFVHCSEYIIYVTAVHNIKFGVFMSPGIYIYDQYSLSYHQTKASVWPSLDNKIDVLYIYIYMYICIYGIYGIYIYTVRVLFNS